MENLLFLMSGLLKLFLNFGRSYNESASYSFPSVLLKSDSNKPGGFKTTLKGRPASP